MLRLLTAAYGTHATCRDEALRSIFGGQTSIRHCFGWPTLLTPRNRALEARAKVCIHLEIALAAPHAVDFVAGLPLLPFAIAIGRFPAAPLVGHLRTRLKSGLAESPLG